MSVAGTCEQKMYALASLYVRVTYTSCKTRFGMKAGGLELGSAPKDTTNAIISISGEASAKRLSSQSMCESPWVGHEHEKLHCEGIVYTWIGVNCEENNSYYGKKVDHMWEGGVLITGVLLWLSDIAVIFGCVHCDGCCDDGRRFNTARRD
jgi:hypothetical protein